jgi:murein DD-endopeptidase MepM/ murein hydrolase activator NlpD
MKHSPRHLGRVLVPLLIFPLLMTAGLLRRSPSAGRLPSAPNEAANSGLPAALSQEHLDRGPLVEGSGGGPSAGEQLAEIGYALSHGLSVRLIPWAVGSGQSWAPFGPVLGALWPVPVMQVDNPPPLVSDGSFVWGPQERDFDIAAFLYRRHSPLAAYADDVAIWASYSSVNPKVLLAVLELRYQLVSGTPANLSPDEIRGTIETTAIDLATSFYQHLYTYGARRTPAGSKNTSPPAIVFADGSTAQINGVQSSGSFAVAAALAMRLSLSDWQRAISSQDSGGFRRIFGTMFSSTDPLATNNNIDPPAAPAADLLQMPFPQQADWYFGGPHSWNGDSTPPFSSMDFYLGGATCSAPPSLYAVAAAGGTAIHPSNYSCWLEIDHGGGWKTSYYHLRDTYAGGTALRNMPMGSIACELCAGGWASGPHVHFSLKYNGAYVSLEGVRLSGWTVHVGPTAYTSGSITRDGVTLAPFAHLVNDYDTYFGTGDYSLRFYASGSPDVGRMLIQVDDPTDTNTSPPADVGKSNDFTIEWWMRALPGENPAPAAACGANVAWTQGNIIIDRRRSGDGAEFGVSLLDGRLAFGVRGIDGSRLTICGTSDVTDGQWHHIAIMRNRWAGTVADGYMWLFVDGALEASGNGPGGSLAYPDDGVPSAPYDNFLVVGGDKYGSGLAFSGWVDELRISNIQRYGGSYSLPPAPFTKDAAAMVLIHFNEGVGAAANDTSGTGGGPSNGYMLLGGSPPGPEWSSDTPFGPPPPTPVPSATPTATATMTATATPTSTPTATRTMTATPTSTSTATRTATATATATRTPGPGPSPTPTLIFGDVPDSYWAAPYINALFNAGYIAGCSAEPRLFCPDQAMTRAESAVFIERGLNGGGYMPPNPSQPVFADVKLSDWFAPWVDALWRDGFTAGCSLTELRYCPNQGHTRAEGAVFYLRMLDGASYTPPAAASMSFSDVAPEAWYADWVEAAYQAGLLLPCRSEPDLAYCPDDPLLRSVGAYMMVQAKDGLPLAAGISHQAGIMAWNRLP